ncbi:MAG: cupin domain-containing protein [Acidimicrobiales bacterium]
MARVLRLGEAERLELRGRVATQILNGADAGDQMTVRVVEVAPEVPGAQARPLHVHDGVGEFIWILQGSGTLHCPQGLLPAHSGEGLYIAPGELHKIVPSGAEPLHLLCVFPTGDIAARTQE